MKLSVFKQAVIDRWELLLANTVFTFQKETAYWADNWASVLSTTFYTISMLIFINVVYANVKVIAGYTHNEMLLFFLVGQLSFYTTWSISGQNMQEFIADVNRGDLDMILTKPFPALFYITFKRVHIFSSIIRDGIPPTLAIIFAINWSQIDIPPLTILIAVCIFLLGQICMHVFEFLAVIPVIWLGESSSIFKLYYDLDSYGGRFIPLEGFGTAFRVIFGTIFPVLIGTGFTTSVLLGKSDPTFLLVWAVLVTIVALYIRDVVWKIAMRSYTSASS